MQGKRPIDIYNAFKDEWTPSQAERVPKEKFKYGTTLESIEDFEHAGKNITFGVTSGGLIMAGWKDKSGAVHQIDVIAPALRVIFGNSMNGLGGKPLLPDGRDAKRQFSMCIVDGDLLEAHKVKIDDNPKNAHLKRKETAKAMFDFLFKLRVMFCLFKARNTDVHVKMRAHCYKMASANAEPHFATDMKYQESQLFVTFWNNMRCFHHQNSEDAEKYLGVKGLQELKITKSDFFVPKEEKDRAKNKAVPVDPRIKKIYDAGPGMSNPDYEFAKEVIDNHQKGNSFTPLNIVAHNNATTFGVFGPFFGPNSTVATRFTIACWEQSQMDGFNGYHVATEVLIGENSLASNAPLNSGYAVGGDQDEQQQKKADEAQASTEHQDKKQKVSVD